MAAWSCTISIAIGSTQSYERDKNSQLNFQVTFSRHHKEVNFREVARNTFLQVMAGRWNCCLSSFSSVMYLCSASLLFPFFPISRSGNLSPEWHPLVLTCKLLLSIGTVFGLSCCIWRTRARVSQYTCFIGAGMMDVPAQFLHCNKLERQMRKLACSYTSMAFWVVRPCHGMHLWPHWCTYVNAQSNTHSTIHIALVLNVLGGTTWADRTLCEEDNEVYSECMSVAIANCTGNNEADLWISLCRAAFLMPRFLEEALVIQYLFVVRTTALWSSRPSLTGVLLALNGFGSLHHSTQF